MHIIMRLMGLIITYVLITNYSVFAMDSEQQINLKLVDRLARLEEGQKSIITIMDKRFEAVDKRFDSVDKRFEAADKRFESLIREMNSRFEAVDQRFESLIREINQGFKSVDKRFEAVDKRFEAVDKRFETVDKQIESVDKRIESVDKRIESVDKRIESLDKRIDQLGNYMNQLGNSMIAMVGTFVTIFIAIAGYAVWDRKTLLKKAKKQSEQLIIDSRPKDQVSLLSIQNTIKQILNIMKQMSDNNPEMRQMMQAAHLV